MGALTLKSFPFELRGWDIEKFKSIDPTDGFGSNTRVYISKNQIVQIEPDYDSQTFNTWLTDKGRQFFDSIFGAWSQENKAANQAKSSIHGEKNMFLQLSQILYLFDHVNYQKNQNNFFTIVVGNLSIESISLLNLMQQKYSFLKIKKADNLTLTNDLESNFQLNLVGNKTKLSSSTLGILVSLNPRYEGYYLNLNLRQRFLKGNFKCFVIGSLINLTFPNLFIGSNFENLKSIYNGTNIICQDIKFAKNPLIIFNSEIFKRSDSQKVINLIKTLTFSCSTWFGYNLLNSNLSENGSYSITTFDKVVMQDFASFSSLYFLNVTPNNLGHLKKNLEARLLNYILLQQTNKKFPKFILDQSPSTNKSHDIFNKIVLNDAQTIKYNHIPVSMFYENEEIFINTEGLIKRTNKLLFNKKTKNSWQVLRKLLKEIVNNNSFLAKNDLIIFNSKKIANFKNFIFFQYQATQTLKNLNYYLSIKTKPFLILHLNNKFKKNTQKISNTKLKYWLTDFFSGGKDEYSQNSFIMANCSKILRLETTNFF